MMVVWERPANKQTKESSLIAWTKQGTTSDADADVDWAGLQGKPAWCCELSHDRRQHQQQMRMIVWPIALCTHVHAS